MERSTMLLRMVNHLFLWAIYTMAMLNNQMVFSWNWMCWTEHNIYLVYGCSIFSLNWWNMLIGFMDVASIEGKHGTSINIHNIFYPQNSLDLMFLRQNGSFLLVVSQPPVAQWQQLPRIILDDEAEQLKLCYQVHGPSTILWRMSKKSVALLKQFDNRS